jgi:hypothetical protein
LLNLFFRVTRRTGRNADRKPMEPLGALFQMDFRHDTTGRFLWTSETSHYCILQARAVNAVVTCTECVPLRQDIQIKWYASQNVASNFNRRLQSNLSYINVIDCPKKDSSPIQGATVSHSVSNESIMRLPVVSIPFPLALLSSFFFLLPSSAIRPTF